MKNLKTNTPTNMYLLIAATFLASITLTTHAQAQTLIYDGSQPLNFFSASRLTDELALDNDPNDETRNGVINAGADPFELEVGDAAWFRSSGRRMRNTDSEEMIGLASTAAGVDGIFMTANTGSTDDQMDARGVGAGYVLYDAGTTTGMQTLNFSLFYNDATPNEPDPGVLRNSGGNVAVRVYGITSSDDEFDPWASDEFTFLAGSGGSGALIASGQHRDTFDTTDPVDPAEPLVEQLLYLDSSSAAGSPIIPVADEWQSLSFPFDAGTGYDYLLFGFAGAEQDGTNLAADRFGFDNISFEAATATCDDSTMGDLDGNGAVEFADFLVLSANFGQPVDGHEAGDIDCNGSVEFADFLVLSSNFGSQVAGAQSVPEPAGNLLVACAALTCLLIRQRKPVR